MSRSSSIFLLLKSCSHVQEERERGCHSGYLQEEEQVRLAAAIKRQVGVEGVSVGAVVAGGGRRGGVVRGDRGRGVVAEVICQLEEARQTEPRVALLGTPRHLEAVHERHRVARDLDRARRAAADEWHANKMLEGIR
jgi:hypothetical protein